MIKTGNTKSRIIKSTMTNKTAEQLCNTCQEEPYSVCVCVCVYAAMEDSWMRQIWLINNQQLFISYVTLWCDVLQWVD